MPTRAANLMTLQPIDTTSRPRFDISVPGQVPTTEELGEDGVGEREVHGMSPRPRDDPPRESSPLIGQQVQAALEEKSWNVWENSRPSELKVPEKDHERISSKLSGRTSDSNDLDNVLKAEVAMVTSWQDDVRMYCRLLCQDWRFLVCTTILTVFALIGDDARLLLTSREADNFFNILIVLAFMIFSTEIVAASLGVRGYFNSFFFYLDLIATSTMLLDLTWFGNVLYCKDHSDLRPTSQNSFETFLSNLTDTRASRAVRILRLVRLGKLCKFYVRSADHSRAEPLHGVPPGNPLESQPSGHSQDWDLNSDVVKPDDQEEAPEDKEGAQEETRVGKKLSDMTSRRVIILILVMLFCSFFFTVESWGKEFALSGSLGPNLIYERFRSWCPTSAVTPWCLRPAAPEQNQPGRQEQRAWYEQYLQGFIRSHLSGPFAWRLYWVGLGSTTFSPNNESSAEFLGTLAQLNQQQWLGVSLPKEELWRWDSQGFGNSNPIPQEVKERLVSPWREQCLGFVGVPLYSDSAAYSMSTACSVSDQLRCNEVHYEMPMLQTRLEADNVNLLFVFDTRPITRSEAGLSMLQTFFICVALAVGAISFSKDADHLLLAPLERILVKLEAIRKNPLHAMKLGDIEYREQELEEEGNGEKRFCCNKRRDKSSELETLETAILERTLIKLGGLLALGFGEAGAEIIVHNMQGGTSAELNAMVPGQEVEAVFGFCSIRNFGDATDVLKEKVMVFVNQVSEIVHGICDTYHGSPNKIIGGNSFLVVWRMRGRDPELRAKIADMAVMSFVCITIEVQKSNTLATYRSHPGLQQRFPNFRVTLGFGLHCGWAIEGAIGSEYKIDASYLSPNVNVASQLEAASGQLGLWVLLSNYMVKLCSPDLLPYFRMIDNVMLEGSKKTLRLYTLDLDHSRVNVKPKLRGTKKKVYNRYKVRQMREAVKNELWTSDFDIMEVLSGHSDFIEMREPYSKEFFERFAVGVRNYEAGEWLVARDLFITCHYSEELCKSNSQPGVWPTDGPVKSLLEFMEKYHFEAPSDWPGYRHLIPGSA